VAGEQTGVSVCEPAADDERWLDLHALSTSPPHECPVSADRRGHVGHLVRQPKRSSCCLVCVQREHARPFTSMRDHSRAFAPAHERACPFRSMRARSRGVLAELRASGSGSTRPQHSKAAAQKSRSTEKPRHRKAAAQEGLSRGSRHSATRGCVWLATAPGMAREWS